MRIAVAAGGPRARVELVVGSLAPRLISRGARHVHVGVTAAEMLLLDGDTVEVSVQVGPGCVLHIEDIGGTVAYPRRNVADLASPPARWLLDLQVARGGVLLWQGLPFVVAGAADVVRHTTLTLAEDARAVLRETLVLGRHGERGGRVRSGLEIHDDGGPVLLEELTVDGERPEPGVLGDRRVADTLLAAGFRPPSEQGDLRLEAPGALARHLGSATHDSPLDERFQRWAAAAES